MLIAVWETEGPRGQLLGTCLYFRMTGSLSWPKTQHTYRGFSKQWKQAWNVTFRKDLNDCSLQAAHGRCIQEWMCTGSESIHKLQQNRVSTKFPKYPRTKTSYIIVQCTSMTKHETIKGNEHQTATDPDLSIDTILSRRTISTKGFHSSQKIQPILQWVSDSTPQTVRKAQTNRADHLFIFVSKICKQKSSFAPENARNFSQQGSSWTWKIFIHWRRWSSWGRWKGMLPERETYWPSESQ